MIILVTFPFLISLKCSFVCQVHVCLSISRTTKGTFEADRKQPVLVQRNFFLNIESSRSLGSSFIRNLLIFEKHFWPVVHNSFTKELAHGTFMKWKCWLPSTYMNDSNYITTVDIRKFSHMRVV